jgi:hypothetical protein
MWTETVALYDEKCHYICTDEEHHDNPQIEESVPRSLLEHWYFPRVS